jgi:hypothetical protein
MHLDGGRGKATLVSAATMEKLHTAWPGGDYALGWGIRGKGDGTVLVHDGSNTMFLARIWLMPAKNAGVLAATNVAGDDAGGALFRTIAYLRARFLK